MRRRVAVIWHASFCIAAGVLYFYFVLPRWYELMGATSHTLGTVLRIVAGVLIGLAALPVVFTLLRTRRPEFGTPQLALTLRTSSIALHVLAGALIIGTAISEIWLSLDDAGQWVFGSYGAAAALALLGMFAFYLADVAELPPPPPKPLKPKERKQRRGRRKPAEAAEEEEAAVEEAEQAAEVTAADHAVAEDETPAEEDKSHDEPADEATNGKLRNRRPSGKAEPTRRRRRRVRGGVAVED
jgi:MFS family permease